MPSDHLSAEDLAELERLYDDRMRYVRAGIASSSSLRALGRLSNALVRDCPRLLAMIKEQGESIRRFSMYDPAKVLDLQIEEVKSRERAEQAEAEVQKLRMPEQIARTAADISTSCGISYQAAHFSIMDATTMAADRDAAQTEVERLRAALDRVEKEAASLDELSEEPLSEDMRSAMRLAARSIRSALAGDDNNPQAAETCELCAEQPGITGRNDWPLCQVHWNWWLDTYLGTKDAPVRRAHLIRASPPEPFDMAPAEIDEFLGALEDPPGGDQS